MGLTARGGWPFDRALVREPLLGSRVCTSRVPSSVARGSTASPRSLPFGGGGVGLTGFPNFKAYGYGPRLCCLGFGDQDSGFWVRAFSRIREKGQDSGFAGFGSRLMAYFRVRPNQRGLLGQFCDSGTPFLHLVSTATWQWS